MDFKWVQILIAFIPVIHINFLNTEYENKSENVDFTNKLIM